MWVLLDLIRSSQQLIHRESLLQVSHLTLCLVSLVLVVASVHELLARGSLSILRLWPWGESLA